MSKRTILVENAVNPGRPRPVNAEKYEAMRKAYLAVMPVDEPGATPSELKAKLLPGLPDDLFPGGDTAGWRAKCVQLDLEAKGAIVRSPRPPVRLRKA